MAIDTRTLGLTCSSTEPMLAVPNTVLEEMLELAASGKSVSWSGG